MFPRHFSEVEDSFQQMWVCSSFLWERGLQRFQFREVAAFQIYFVVCDLLPSAKEHYNEIEAFVFAIGAPAPLFMLRM